jgi:hypothetical protein
MIFEILEYLFGEIKMLIYKLFYLRNLKYQLIGKYSNKVQIRLLKKGKLVLLAVFDLYALIRFMGQEKPKHTSITVSKIADINTLRP